MVPFMLMMGGPNSDVDMGAEMEDSPLFFTLVFLVDSLCCFYPAYLWLAKGVTIFSNPKTRIKKLEIKE
jgi:hypothetical protein